MRASRVVISGLAKIDLRLLDALVSLALTAGAMVTLVPQLDGGLPAVTIPSALAATTTVAWRRRFPLLASIVAVFAISALTVAQSGIANSAVTFEPIAMALDYYILGRRTEGPPEAPRAMLGLAVAGLVPLTAVHAGGQSAADIVSGLLIFVVLPFAAGCVLTRWQALTAARAQAVADLAREQDLRVAEAAYEERLRIARELHDAIAHSLSLMVIQTEGARRALPYDGDAAHAALRVVVQSGRQALQELRRTVGPGADEDSVVAGAPELDRIEGLLARTRAAGVPVSLLIEGVPRALPEAIELAAYRVVQEALTNALKHAGATEVSVRLRFGPATLDLDVTDTGGPGGPGEAAAAQGSGLGLTGMRERMVLFGGELWAGPQREGGYRVSARLPLAAATP